MMYWKSETTSQCPQWANSIASLRKWNVQLKNLYLALWSNDNQAVLDHAVLAMQGLVQLIGSLEVT